MQGGEERRGKSSSEGAVSCLLFGKNLTVRVILEYVVQKSCFAAPEEAGQDRHGHPLLLHGRLFFV